MYLLGRPSAASNTMRLRNTTRCAVVPARSQRSSVARCSGVSGKAGARFMASTVPKSGRKYKAIGDHCTSGLGAADISAALDAFWLDRVTHASTHAMLQRYLAKEAAYLEKLQSE